MSVNMSSTDIAKKPAPKDWHRADIKAALEKKGFSIRGFARHHHYSKSAVSKAFNSAYPLMEALIAAELGVDVKTIWPSRYDEHGAPKKGRLTPNSTRAVSTDNVSRRGRPVT